MRGRLTICYNELFVRVVANVAMFDRTKTGHIWPRQPCKGLTLIYFIALGKCY